MDFCSEPPNSTLKKSEARSRLGLDLGNSSSDRFASQATLMPTYLSPPSMLGRHTFRGWILAELLRLLTHSSTVEIWQEEGEFFYHCLSARGYPRVFLRAVFREVTWGRRARMLEPKRKERGSQFFETYRACHGVLTLRNAPEWPALRVQLDLSLRQLVESTYGDIFPPRAFLAQRNAPLLGSILKLS